MNQYPYQKWMCVLTPLENNACSQYYIPFRDISGVRWLHAKCQKRRSRLTVGISSSNEGLQIERHPSILQTSDERQIVISKIAVSFSLRS